MLTCWAGLKRGPWTVGWGVESVGDGDWVVHNIWSNWLGGFLFLSGDTFRFGWTHV